MVEVSERDQSIVTALSDPRRFFSFSFSFLSFLFWKHLYAFTIQISLSRRLKENAVLQSGCTEA